MYAVMCKYICVFSLLIVCVHMIMWIYSYLGSIYVGMDIYGFENVVYEVYVCECVNQPYFW